MKFPLLLLMLILLAATAQAGQLTNNIALGVTNCGSTNNNTASYSCTHLYDDAVGAHTQHWLTADGVLAANATLTLNATWNIANVSLVAGIDYRPGWIKILRSLDGISWTEIIDDPMFCNTNLCNKSYYRASGYGDANYIRLQIMNKSVYNGVGMAEMRLYPWDLLDGTLDPEFPQLTITASDISSGQALSNFSITASNSSFSVTNSTTSGSLKIAGVANLSYYNLSFSSNYSGGYFNQTASIYVNLLTTKAFKAWQTELNLSAIREWTNASISSFNTSETTYKIFNNTGRFLLPAGTYTFNSVAANTYNSSYSLTLTALQHLNYTINLSSGYKAITAKKIQNNLSISSFSVNITNTDTGERRSYSTASGTILASLTNSSNYYIQFLSSDYVTTNATATNTTPLTFYVYQTNSVYFTFKDQQTLETINNITLQLISDLFAQNYSTSTGNISAELISPGAYYARYRSDPSYLEHLYYFSLTNGTSESLTLYLLNNASETEVTASVIDETATAVQGALIYVMKYNPPTNSYITTEILVTNFAGEAKFSVILNSEYYKFGIYTPDGTLKLLTSPTYVYSTTLTFQIIIGQPIAEDFYKLQSIDYDLTYNPATTNFRFDYLDGSGVTSQACLKVYLIGSPDTLLNNTCQSSAAGTILTAIPTINGTSYRADAYVTFGGNNHILASLIQDFRSPPSLTGGSGWFIVLAVALTLLFMGRWHITLPLITLPIWIYMSRQLQLINISLEATIALILIGAIIAVVISRRER